MNLLAGLLRNGPYLRCRKDLYTRLPLALLCSALIGIFPLLIAIAGAWATRKLTGVPCLSEGSCAWAAIPLLCLITFPLALVMMLLVIVKSVQSMKRMRKP